MNLLKDILSHPLRNREHNDCAVVATANVLDIPYDDAHTLLRQQGRRNRCGTKISVSKRALASRATIAEHVIGAPINMTSGFTYHSMHRPTVAQYLRKLPKTGRYWLASTTHAFAYVDGKLLDNIEGGKMRARMHRCFEIKLPEQKSALAQSDISAMWERLNRVEEKL